MIFIPGFSRSYTLRYTIKKNVVKILLICGLFQPAMADENDKEKSLNKRPELYHERKDINESEYIINDIISKQPFVNVQEEIVWNFAEEDEQDDEETQTPPDLTWLTGFVAFISMIIEAALWITPLLAVFYLYRYRKYWLSLLRGESLKSEEILLPDTLFGLDIKRDSLPDDIENTARELWQNNKSREAVSLLYRGSIVRLFDRYRYDLPSGATEQDCIRYVEIQYKTINQKNDNAARQIDRFRKITRIWIEIAYAHRLPGDDIFYELCDQWNQLFVIDMAMPYKVKS